MTEQPLKPPTGFEKNGIFTFPNYPRPDTTAGLFASSGKRKNEVLIGGKDNDWNIYCMGYWRAADALVDHLTQVRGPFVERPYAAYWESQAYATLFLYRHYLELRLKELFLAYGGNASKINREHRLLKLWEVVRKQEESILTEQLPGDVLIDLEVAEKIIIQFDKIDRDSQAFRYPKDRTENITIAPMQIDLIRVKEALGWLSQFLDGWSVGVYEYTHARYE